MPAAYSKLLMPSLADRLEGFLNNGKTRQQQLELYEELAASRMIAEQLMTLMNATLSCGDKVNAETRIHAMRLAQDALNGVADLATKISRIEKDATDVVSVRALGFFVDQITTILHKRLSVVGQDEIAVQLAQDLREQIRLPAPGELADPNCPLGEIEVTYG